MLRSACMTFSKAADKNVGLFCRAALMDWDLQKAGKNLPKLIRQARETGPQTITQHGKPVAVVLAVADYESSSAPSRHLRNIFSPVLSGTTSSPRKSIADLRR
ncbi:Prevent-host-death family protein (modular protein) [Mesorhizobium sp. SOD10]|nr:Prevent-host-death family protein (modular protein) [Mesorhizobium sp. SOD10]